MPCLVAIIDYSCTPSSPQHKNQHIPYPVAIVDYTHLGQLQSSGGRGNSCTENSSNQIADALVAHQLQDLVKL